MLVTDEVLFIHAPKTGGISVTEYLIWNLPGRKLLFLPADRDRPRPLERARNLLRQVRYVDGDRHAPLAGVLRQLQVLGRSLDDFRTVLAVIRNPYDLEVSRFAYYARSYHRGLTELARSGDFDRFCRVAGYPWGTPSPIEDWYTLGGELPANMRLLRFEQLADGIHSALPSITRERRPLRHRNPSARGDWHTFVTADNEPMIYEKYRWLFRFYDRHHADDGDGPQRSGTR